MFDKPKSSIPVAAGVAVLDVFEEENVNEVKRGVANAVHRMACSAHKVPRTQSPDLGTRKESQE